MMKRTFALAFACALALTACDSGPAYQPNLNNPPKEDNECPRADGQPCR